MSIPIGITPAGIHPASLPTNTIRVTNCETDGADGLYVLRNNTTGVYDQSPSWMYTIIVSSDGAAEINKASTGDNIGYTANNSINGLWYTGAEIADSDGILSIDARFI